MTCPVAPLTICGLLIVPVTMIAGRVSKLPILTHTTALSKAGVAPGNPIGSVTGRVSGLITGAGSVAVWRPATVAYFLGSGATSGIVKMTSDSVGFFAAIFAPPT